MRLIPAWPGIATAGALLFAGCSGRSLPVSVNIPMEQGATSMALHEGILWAGTPGKGLARIDRDGNLEYFGEKAGLTGNLSKVRWVESFRDYLLIATDGGVGRFSPKSRKLLEAWKESDGLANSRVRWVGAARGEIWAGTIRGASRRESGGKWRSYGSGSGLPSVHVYRMLYAGNALWAACINGGLARYLPERDRFVEIERKRGMGNRHVYALAPGTDGIWLGTAAGMDFYRNGPGSWDEKIGANGFTDYAVYAAAQIGDALWFATAYGLYRRSLNSGEQKVYGASDGLPADRIVALLPQGNALWVATTAGIVLVGAPRQ